MFSKGLGYYVHKHLENYRNFGIEESRKGRENPRAWAQQSGQALSKANTEAKKMIESISKENKNYYKDLENYLTDIWFNKNNFGLSEKEIAEIRETILKSLNEKFDNKINIKDSQGYEYGKIVGQAKDSMRKINSTNQKGIRQSTFQSMINNLSKILEAITKGEMDKNENLIKDINELLTILNQGEKEFDGVLISGISFNNDTYKFSAQGKNSSKIIDKYNKIIKSISGYSAKIGGDIGELFVSLAMLLKENKIDDVLKDIPKLLGQAEGYITGGSEHAQKVARLELSDFIKEENLINSLDKGIINTVFHADDQTSQITADVQIAGMKASVKNYATTYGGVHILGNYSLRNALGLFDTNFANHYLNLVATHADYSLDGEEKNMLDKYEDTIEKGVSIRALSGIRWRDYQEDNVSNTFIVIDDKAERVRVYSTQSALKEIMKNFNKYIKVKGMPEFAVQMDLDCGSAQERIVKLLASIHEFKLNLSLNSAFFNPQQSKNLT